jgi:group II intron reverse transcriptase/maturase
MQTSQLLETMFSSENLNRALKQVKSNNGCAGIDRLSISATIEKLKQGDNGNKFRQSLLNGTYQPQPVLGVEIPKAKGGVRQLGIPTVQDRIVQQAISNVLTGIYEPKFSNSSYGFRPRRSAHHALAQGSKFIRSGLGYVVDIDLEKYFDTVNHDRLMNRLSRDIEDKRVLKLIRHYLQSDLMRGGIAELRQKGTPQGGPLSPLLSNIVLDELDKELESRGHKFCRYADDCQIYVNSEVAAKRVLLSISCFLEGKLKLKVNQEKSKATRVSERSFLGHYFKQSGEVRITRDAYRRMKIRVRKLTKRNQAKSLPVVIKELNQYLRGWQSYYKLALFGDRMKRLDSWIRRRLRCYKLKQRKRKFSIAVWLIKSGLTTRDAWNLAKSDKGWWKLSRTPQLHQALPDKQLAGLGLYSLQGGYEALKIYSKPPYATHACTVA